MAPLFDGAQIGKEIEGATHLLERVSHPVVWDRIEASFDIAPILLQQRAQVREEALPVRHRPPAQLLRH